MDNISLIFQRALVLNICTFVFRIWIVNPHQGIMEDIKSLQQKYKNNDNNKKFNYFSLFRGRVIPFDADNMYATLLNPKRSL